MFIPIADPEPNRVFSQEFERDPITHDLWEVNRKISVGSSNVETPAGVVATSQQMPSGLWVNTTRKVNLPGRVQHTRRQSEEFGLIDMTQQYVDAATGIAAVAASLGSKIEAEYKDINDAFGLLTQAAFTAPISREDTEYDPETGCKITIARVLATTALTSQTAGTEVTTKQINAGLFLNVTRSINLTCANAGYSTHAYVPFSRPRVLTGADFIIGEDGLHLNVNPIATGGYQKLIAGRRDFVFVATEPALASLFQIIPTYFNYRGTYFNIPWGDMITDEITIFDIGGTFAESVTFAASTPTATAYLAAIGTYVRFAMQSTKWRFNLFKSEQLYILLE